MNPLLLAVERAVWVAQTLPSDSGVTGFLPLIPATAAGVK